MHKLAIAGCVGALVAAVGFAAPGTSRAEAVVVPVLRAGGAPPVQGAQLVGSAPATGQLSVQVWLRPRTAAAEAYASAVSTPGSAAFHHYLGPAAWTAAFGPSAASAGAVQRWLRSRGLGHVGVDAGRNYVTASGSVSAVESALGVHVARYRSAAAGEFWAADRAAAIPAALAPEVLSVTGLDGARQAASTDAAPGSTAPAAAAAANAAATPAAKPKAPTCSHYWGEHGHAVRPEYHGLAQISLPACGYSATQLRAAYGASSSATGKGQTVALTESEAPVAMPQTLAAYAKANHLPAPGRSQFRQLSAGKACRNGTAQGVPTRSLSALTVDDESEMDSEAVYLMAPAAAQVMVVGQGCDEDQALLDAVAAVLTGNGHKPLASIVSNSWQIPQGEVPAATVHALFVRAAAEGVGMYIASGDTPGLTGTDDDPYAISVGGTTLGLGRANQRLFETGWSSDYVSLDQGRWSDQGLGGAGGGGVSDVYRQPAFQRGVVPAAMSRTRIGGKPAVGRTVPDLAAVGDPDTGMLTGYTDDPGPGGRPGAYRTEPNAGTSLATPLIAGLIADAQQGQPGPFGFADPLFYRLAGSSAFHDALPLTTKTPARDRGAYQLPDGTFGTGMDLFDDQNRKDTAQVTARGYDTMTGLGTPNGTAFVTALRRAAH